ncbi:hypothetical protein ISN45_Un55g000320 [Arabidopsis thaliana x Arabidopsis arenosa]|uniref:Plant thionin family protein n=1 Tax=Arabidopsis thaliana x Arabidopsis arenosa TaxID=1240361 RepID=A0A8T1XIN6_9BRAS|nr:hypothetical protein ISN45_Un55g000320 [Arabidopsis thaliana x Arabidopsis arenosa]
MTRGMTPTKAELVVISLIWAILVLESATVSSAVEDLVVEQCKHDCKHDIHNKKECEDRCNEQMMMEMEKETSGRQEEEHNPFCDAFCKPFEGLYQQCMAVCPRTKSIGGDGVANGELQANEEVCETSCSILQEEPLTIRCMRICHERIPGAVASST